MSEASLSWIDWFLKQSRGKYFARISKQYLTNSFNYYGVRQRVNMFEAALELIINGNVDQKYADMSFASQAVVVEEQAEILYGILHSRFLLTEEGLEQMKKKYDKGEFPCCPRKLCQHCQCLPYGVSNDLNEHPVKIFCPCCREVYNLKDYDLENVDGAFFGNSWIHIFIEKYKFLFENYEKKMITPSIYGFRVSETIYNDEEEDETF